MRMLLDNHVLLSALLGWFVAQTTKVILSIIQTKRFDPERISGAGGMPSSHSSLVTALTVATAIVEGFDSTAFAVAIVFAFVTIYDALGVRRQAGLHAQMLNKIMRDTAELKEMEDLRDGVRDEDPEELTALKEYIGHKLPEVIVGIVIGGVVATLVCLL